MPRPSFHEWLRSRPDEALAADNLAMLIARSPAGISPDEIGRALRLPLDTLNDILGSLVTTGQIVVRKVNGQLVYRATM
jgi:hypothetical protein